MNRTLLKLPCYSSAKPPKPTYTLPTVISSGLYTSRPLINLKDLTTPAPCGENEDTPDKYLINKDSPHGGVTKTSSPNGKRVSPPHSVAGASPNRKGGRKLILRSIPSFPSLAGDGFSDCFGNTQKGGSFSSTSLTRGVLILSNLVVFYFVMLFFQCSIECVMQNFLYHLELYEFCHHTSWYSGSMTKSFQELVSKLLNKMV